MYLIRLHSCVDGSKMLKISHCYRLCHYSFGILAKSLCRYVGKVAEDVKMPCSVQLLLQNVLIKVV